jgi:hypothetical protein
LLWLKPLAARAVQESNKVREPVSINSSAKAQGVA